MRAAVCREFGRPPAVEDVELAAPGPGEVRVGIAACAICHSDLSFLDGAWGGNLPSVVGHEAAGVVLETGHGASGLETGTHVVVTLVRSCGVCPACARGAPALCEAVFPLDRRSPLRSAAGEEVAQGLRVAAFAE